MDIGRAFSFVFEDDEWIKKILVGGAISLIPFIGAMIISGYNVEVARRAFNASGVDELPDWDDIGGYLTRGFFYWAAIFIWMLPVILLIVCGALAAIAAGIATGEGAVIGASIFAFYLFIFPLILLLSIVSAAIFPVLLGRYAFHQRFGAMFEFSEIVADLKRIQVVPMLLLIVTTAAAGYIGQLGFMLCLVGIVFTSFYGSVAAAHAAGQTYRLAQGLEPLVPATSQLRPEAIDS